MKTLSIVIPVYNEEKRVHAAFKSLLSYRGVKGVKIEKVIFVNDGSRDNTSELIASFIKRNHKLPCGALVELISYKKNRGRGYAVKRGLLNVSSDYGLYTDGDFSMPLSNLPKFIPLMNEGYDLMIGSKKKIGAKATPQRSMLRQLVGYGHSVLAGLVLGVFVWDFQGGFKMFSSRFIKEVVRSSKQERWGLDMEVIFLAKKLNYRFFEVAMNWRSVNEGTTVKLGRDIKRAFFDMLAIRKLWNANYRAYRFSTAS